MLNVMDVLVGVARDGSTPLASQCMALGCLRLIVKRLTGNYSRKITKVWLDRLLKDYKDEG